MIRIAFAADINGLPKNAQPTRVSAVVRKAAGKEVIMTFDFPVDKFADGRQETMVELPSLAGEYEIAMKAEGLNCPQGETVKTFERTVFPWENLAAGRSTMVYPPFTPIQVEGGDVDGGIRPTARGSHRRTTVRGTIQGDLPRHLGL